MLLTGGALGTLARYSAAAYSYKLFGSAFPYGTLAVNIIGSFVIGFAWSVSEAIHISPNAKIFLFVGLLGGFTTFSSYSLETLNLFRDGETKIAIMNILANNIIGLTMVMAGFFGGKGLLNLFN